MKNINNSCEIMENYSRDMESTKILMEYIYA